MDSHGRSGMVTGILLIVATSAGILGLVSQPMTGAPDFLAKIYADEPTVLFSALMLFVMGLTGAGVGIAMYPVLRRQGEGIALGVAGFRIMEGTFHSIGAVLVILMVGLSREFIKATPADPTPYRIIGAILIEGHGTIISVAGILCWCTAAFMYYWLFFKARLIPRWLSLWGLIGIALALTACMMILFRLTTDKETMHSLLNLPIFLQEMVMAVWLIVKGFKRDTLHG